MQDPSSPSNPSAPASDDPSLVVREAGQGDVAAMAGLLGVLFSQEADFQPSGERQRRALELILAKPEIGQLFVACQGSDVVGMVSLLFTVSTAEGGEVAWLEDLVVRQDRRGRGLGSRLLAAAVAHARGRRLARISLLTDASNAGAQALYRRHGFVPSAMRPLRLYLSSHPTHPAPPILERPSSPP